MYSPLPILTFPFHFARNLLLELSRLRMKRGSSEAQWGQKPFCIGTSARLKSRGQGWETNQTFAENDKASRKEVFVTGVEDQRGRRDPSKVSAHTQMLRIVLLVLAFVNDISGISFVIVVHRISDAHCFAFSFGIVWYIVSV